MPYVLANNIATRRLNGQYIDANYTLPTDPSTAGAIASAAKASARKTLGGSYQNATYAMPPYRNPGMGAVSLSSMSSWLTSPNALISSLNNAEVYGGIAALAYLMVGKKRR